MSRDLRHPLGDARRRPEMHRRLASRGSDPTTPNDGALSEHPGAMCPRVPGRWNQAGHAVDPCSAPDRPDTHDRADLPQKHWCGDTWTHGTADSGRSRRERPRGDTRDAGRSVCRSGRAECRAARAGRPARGRSADGRVATRPTADPLANTRLHAAVFIRHEETHRFDIAQLLEAWGLTHKTTFVFNRVIHQGPSAYNSIIHEYLLLAVRGRLAPDRLVPMEPSIQVCKSDGPVPVERLQELIRRLYDGPYLLVQAADIMTSWDQKEGQR